MLVVLLVIGMLAIAVDPAAAADLIVKAAVK